MVFIKIMSRDNARVDRELMMTNRMADLGSVSKVIFHRMSVVALPTVLGDYACQATTPIL